MPRGKRTDLNLTALDGYEKETLAALEHVHDADWLGANSPLAAPYFLGRFLSAADIPQNGFARGRALADLLKRANAALEAERQNALAAAFFERRQSQSLERVITEKLFISRRGFYRLLPMCVRDLARALNAIASPALEAERPPARACVGRDDELNACLAALRGGQSVALVGAAGVGKTSVGLLARDGWSDDPTATCWITLRPGLNDTLYAAVFALAYSLHLRGASSAWMQVISESHRRQHQPEVLLNVLRHDLKSLPNQDLLVCVDDADILQAELEEHRRVLELLDDIRRYTPMLVMSQRGVTQTDISIPLIGLGVSASAALLLTLDVTVADETLNKIHALTGGNAASLRAVAALIKTSDTPDSALALLPQSPSLEAFVDRLRRRLSAEELFLVDALSVYRQSAPADEWHAAPAPLHALLQRGLVDVNAGGLTLEPHIKGIIYQRLRPDARAQLHLWAANAMQKRGNAIEAVYHFIYGDDHAAAVHCWSIHADAEIEQGNAAAALVLLRQIRPDRLPNDEYRALLRFNLSNLLKLFGKAAEAEEELALVSPSTSGLPRAYWLALQAELQGMQGYYQQAVDRYQEAIHLLVRSPQKRLVEIHVRRANIEKYKLNKASEGKKDILLARLEAEAFAGEFEEKSGNLSQAESHYKIALALTDQIDGELERKAWAYSKFAGLCWKQDKLNEAREWLGRALANHRARGDLLSECSELMTLAAIEIVSKNYLVALDCCQKGLEIAQKFAHTYYTAGHASNTAETLYYLDRFDEAIHMANYCLSLEEEWFRASAVIITGWVYAKQGKLELAEKTFREGIQLAQESEDPAYEAPAWLSLAGVYRAQAKPAPAREACARALALYKKMGLAKETAEAEQLMAELLNY